MQLIEKEYMLNSFISELNKTALGYEFHVHESLYTFIGKVRCF
jgi:hypothetical protein